MDAYYPWLGVALYLLPAFVLAWLGWWANRGYRPGADIAVPPGSVLFVLGLFWPCGVAWLIWTALRSWVDSHCPQPPGRTDFDEPRPCEVMAATREAELRGKYSPLVSRYGVPRGTIIDHGEYLLGFDERPLWSLEVLHGPVESVARNGDFHVDPDVPAERRADQADYLDSGWDIGHLTCAEDRGANMQATFFYSNACPENPSLNRGLWAEIEHIVRQSVADGERAWVVTFPQYGCKPKLIGPHHVPVPEFIAKSMLVVRDGKPSRLVTWECDNTEPAKTTRPEHCVVKTAAAERKAGLVLWPLLTEKQKSELELATAAR